MSAGATLVASFLVTLARPALWPLALATFLLRGGILLVVAPIIVIPSAVGVATMVGPLITSFVFGGVSASLVVTVAAAIVVVVTWLIVGGLLAAAAEASSIVLVATDDDVRAPVATNAAIGIAVARRVLTVRLIAHVPLLLALAWGAIRIVSVTYRELTLPSDVVTPLVIRVVRGAPDVVALLIVTWLIGEVVGALAARRVVGGGDGVGQALTGAIIRVIRHPIRTAVVTVIPLVALLAVLIPSAAAATAAWTALRASLSTDAGPLIAITLLGAFVVLWAGGLVLLGVIGAWRSAAWTVESAGTFGGVAPDRPGGWNPGDESGTLSDLRPRGVDPDPR